MLQWFISPFSMRSWLWFNLLRFCCWIAVLRSRQFNNCHRIISVYETGRQRLLLICGCGDARHLRDRFRIMRRVTWSRRSRVAPCDPRRPSRQTGREKKKNERVRSQRDVYALREQWSKSKQPEPKITNPWDHTHTRITPFKPIYKHYLYFVHTLFHAHTLAHTHSHWASNCYQHSHHRDRPFVVLIEHFLC